MNSHHTLFPVHPRTFPQIVMIKNKNKRMRKRKKKKRRNKYNLCCLHTHKNIVKFPLASTLKKTESFLPVPPP